MKFKIIVAISTVGRTLVKNKIKKDITTRIILGVT